MNRRSIAPLAPLAGAAAFAVLTALAATPPAAAEPARYEIDPAHSSATFAVRHFVSQVPGRFDQLSGALAYDPENPAASSVEITIDAASIDTNNPKRDTHLRSADFFDVENHPSLTFKSTAVKAAAGGLEVTGDLTIRGVTKQVTVPVTVLGTMGDRAGFAARFTVNRQDYGVSWNRTLDTGGVILGDEVTIDVSVEAKKEAPPPPAG